MRRGSKVTPSSSQRSTRRRSRRLSSVLTEPGETGRKGREAITDEKSIQRVGYNQKEELESGKQSKENLTKC